MTPETGSSVPMGAFEALNRGTELLDVSSGLHFYDLIPGWYWLLLQQRDFVKKAKKPPRLEEVREDSSGASNRKSRNYLEDHT